MSTHKTNSHSTQSTPQSKSNQNNDAKEAQVMTTTTMNQTPSTVPATTTPALPPPVPPPPVSMSIPVPAAGFTPVKGGFARGVRPRKAEVVVMPGAVAELRSFLDWQVTLGKAAPNQSDMVGAFDSASQWTLTRSATRLWSSYASNEEGVAWTGVRAFMAIVKPLLKAAVVADPSIATTYPKLCALFGAKSAIAKTATSTRAANKASKAKGEPATHGAVGKQQKKAAAKAALAEKQAAVATKVVTPVTTPGPTTTGGAGSNGVAHA